MQNSITSSIYYIQSVNKVYKYNELQEVMNIVRTNFRIIKTKKQNIIKYFNVPASFDIETSNFYENNGKDKIKVAIMYVWTCCIYGVTIMGRTWEEFIFLMNDLVRILNLNENKRFVIYVHNLSFDFQFFRKWFVFQKVFAIESRTPVYAITDCGIEFRCSYILSGYSLNNIAKNLTNISIKKLVGDLDYNKVRHAETPLSEKEIAYAVNDVKIIVAYIQNKIETDGDITKIPLTKTGYVRNYCRNQCFYEDGIKKRESLKRLYYKELMSHMILDRDSYYQLKRAFQGGFTHANAFASNKIIKHVYSQDLTSSYPAVMLSEKYPCSSPELIDILTGEEFEYNLNYYCCIFDVTFYNLETVLWYESPLSKSKCRNCNNVVTNNGRIVSASCLTTTITEQDYFTIKKFYSWESKEISNFRRMKKDYLPKDFILSIMQLYCTKQKLKGNKEKIVEYNSTKEMVNACYGMTVTDILREEHLYIDKWLTREEIPHKDIEKAINKENRKPTRFLYYAWGVWVTAYARRNLFSAIISLNVDYIYSDTDCVKYVNYNKHKKYFEDYNKIIKMKIDKLLDFYGIESNQYIKDLGLWDSPEYYSKFKTLGAKRYMYIENGKYHLTISGVNKQKAMPYLYKKYGKKVFEYFTHDLFIPGEYSGSLTHTYIDEEREGGVYDYMGNLYHYYEKSGTHLEPSTYSLSISQEYSDFTQFVRFMN